MSVRERDDLVSSNYLPLPLPLRLLSILKVKHAEEAEEGEED